jgi:hypothetical protein
LNAIFILALIKAFREVLFTVALKNEGLGCSIKQSKFFVWGFFLGGGDFLPFFFWENIFCPLRKMQK